MSREHEHNLALIVGGTSGLGLELATLLSTRNNFEVYVTGRKDPDRQRIRFVYLDIDSHTGNLSYKIDRILSDLPQTIDLLIYAAGFYQENTVKLLSDEEIIKMINVGLVAPTLLLSRVLNQQETLPGFIAITSTSQWSPGIYEPVYTAIKSGLGMFANSLSLDPQVRKVLVVGPAGMKTNFWFNTSKDTSTMLEPVWVAERVCQLYFEDEFKYKCAKILRNPPEVQLLEKR